jgi:hypothetical protein
MIRRHCGTIIASLLFVHLAAAGPGIAQDRVWLEPVRATSAQGSWYPRAVESLAGKVLDLDADQLRLVLTADGNETVVAARRVLWIEPGELSEGEAQAQRRFVAEEYSACLTMLPEILKQRPPVWRQQWMTMLAAGAAWRSGRSKIALELVSQLDRRPLPPLVLSWLPVAWRGGAQPPDAVTAAEARLNDDSPAVQLVAASWLLSSARRSEASDVLRKLAAGPQQPIAVLAETLLWRTASPPEVIAAIDQWHARLDTLPMVLQVGPTLTLIDKLRDAGQAEAADRLQWTTELVPIHPHPGAGA